MVVPAEELKVTSLVPSAFKRISFATFTPLKVTKEPPKIIFPSGCIKEQYTLPSMPEPKLNERSLEPSGSNLHKYGVEAPLKFKKSPPTISFPSVCKTTVLMVPSKPSPCKPSSYVLNATSDFPCCEKATLIKRKKKKIVKCRILMSKIEFPAFA